MVECGSWSEFGLVIVGVVQDRNGNDDWVRLEFMGMVKIRRIGWLV